MPLSQHTQKGTYRLLIPKGRPQWCAVAVAVTVTVVDIRHDNETTKATPFEIPRDWIEANC